jgi:hypothetical protein
MFSNVWFSIGINICISLLIIYGLHIFWNYIKDNYSKPKTKNLVNTQTEKYKKIIEELQQSRTSEIIPVLNQEEMYNELNEFMNTSTIN